MKATHGNEQYLGLIYTQSLFRCLPTLAVMLRAFKITTQQN